MWLIFLFLAIAATLILLVHVTLELNKVDKSLGEMAQMLRKQYGR